jgi:hypothetical protein
MNKTPLNDLARRISKREAELQRLRHEFEERQQKLASLSQRKEGLQAQIRQIEAETALLVTGKVNLRGSKQVKRAKRQQARKAKSTLATATASSGRKGPSAGLSLPHLIVKIVQEAHSPLSVNQIAKEALGRGFTSSSRNFPKMVAIRLHELRKKGMLRSADDQSGFVLGKSSRTRAESVHRSAPSKRDSRNGTPAGWNHSKSSKGKHKGQNSLRSVLTKLLERSKGPLLVRDLAKQALASGYHSKSNDFENVVQVTVGRMDELVNVRGKGYRLKNGKA